MNDDYSGQTAIYGGMFGPPSWAQGLDLYEWVQVPSNTLASINPANNAAINPNYPSAAPWRGVNDFKSIMSAWCGACYDDSTGEYWIPLGGGHDDYAGNEPYKAQILADTVQWQMVRNPSGAVGNVITLNDGQENTGLYSDGRLRAVHNYGNCAAANGKVYVLCLQGQYSSGATCKFWVVEIDRNTGEYRLVCDYSATATRTNNGYGSGAIDPTRNIAFVAGRGAARITRIDLTTGTAQAITPISNILNEFGYSSAVYAKGVDRVIIVSKQSTNNAYSAWKGLTVINPANNAVIYPSCDNFPSFIRGAPAAVWQHSQNRLLVWDNTTETNKIAVITPSNINDLSQPWIVSVITGTGATPTAAQVEGTFNRMQYSERLGGLLLVNAFDQQFYFMRTD